MPPNPLKDSRDSPTTQTELTSTNGITNGAVNSASIPDVAVISDAPSLLTHTNTQDRLIGSDDQEIAKELMLSPTQSPKLSTCKRILYGLASPPSPMCTNIIGFLMAVYLLETAKLPPSYILTISFAGRFWDAISDPVVGILVSKTRSRFGQCRIWIAASSPLCAGSFFLFFCTPPWDSLQGRYIYYFVTYFAFCTFLTTYQIPYTSMTMLISDRPVDRDAATTLRMIFEMVGTLFGVVVFGFITQSGDRCASQNVTITADVTPEEEQRYRLGAGLIAGIVILCGCVGFFGTREIVSPNAKSLQEDGDEECGSGVDSPSSLAPLSAFAAFRRCLKHKSYLQLMLAFMLSSLAVQIVQNSLALYTIYSLNMKSHLRFAIAIVMLVAIVSAPGVFLLIKWIGKKRVYHIGMMLVIPVCLTAFLCPDGQAYVPVYYATVTFAGLFVCISMLLPWIMLPDAIDDYTAITGRRDQATFYSLYVFFNKFAVGISTALLQLALHFAGYRQPPACHQPAMIGRVLRWMIGPLPILITVLGMIVLHWYPITPKYRQQLDARLQLMQQAGNGKVAIQLGSGNSCISQRSKHLQYCDSQALTPAA